MSYRRRQVGWFLMALSDVLFAVGVVLIVIGDAAMATGIVLLVGGATMTLLSVLTVTIDDTGVSATFLAGWPKRHVMLGDISSVSRVRNRSWWGVGVRRVPGGWMYNVGGLDAIEIELRSGKRFRIGTDRPDELAAAFVSAGVPLR